MERLRPADVGQALRRAVQVQPVLSDQHARPDARGAAAAQIDGTFERYHAAIYKAMWVDGRNLNDMAEIAAVLGEAGLDAGKVGGRIQDQDVKDRLKATTDEAVARGVFGAPTSFVGDMMFFGNDRLPFVEMALKGELK